MNDDYDIDFLADHRPRPDAPSQTDTEYARASLIAHGRRRRHRRRIAAGAQVTVLVAAVVAVIVAVGASSGHGHAAPPTVPIQAAQAPKLPRHHHAAPSPLMKLATRLRALPTTPVTGDATLVHRDTLYNGRARPGYGGYDLYVDTGQYYYSAGSLTELQQSVDDNVNEDAPGELSEAQTEARLAAVAGGTPAQTRAAALAAAGYSRSIPSRASQYRRWAAQDELLKKRFPFHAWTAKTWRLSQDSALYILADQALQAGVGRADVQAGAMKALSTLQGVTETPTTVHGVAALKVVYPATDEPEVLWLNARTGVPIQENDGGGSTTVYTIERVTAAHLPTTISSDAQTH